MNADSATDQHVNASQGDTSSPPSGFSQLSPQQVGSLFKNCVKKQKKKKKGGGGGGGGDDRILPRPGPPSNGGFGDSGDDDCPNWRLRKPSTVLPQLRWPTANIKDARFAVT
jgi:hypothetical protein